MTRTPRPWTQPEPDDVAVPALGRLRTVRQVEHADGLLARVAYEDRRGLNTCAAVTWVTWCRRYAVQYWRGGVDLLAAEASGSAEATA